MPTSQHVVHRDTHDLTPSTPIGYLAQGSMFWQPEYLQPSAWLEHLPALFWLVETVQPSHCMTLGVHQGAAHFALCQAVKRLRLDARCYGVQPQAGLSEAEAADYRLVQEYHARHYGALSQLINTTPREALEQRAPGSLDLLVFNLAVDTPDIDTLIELAASRLSACGVLVLSGIERHEPGARLHEVFQRLAREYPAFGFGHGDGMGIVAVGETPPNTLLTLLQAQNTPGTGRVLGEVFHRLGRSCADAVESQEARRRAAQLSHELEQLQQTHEQRLAELDEVSRRLSTQGQSYAREQGQTEARLAMLQEQHEAQHRELAQLRQQPVETRENEAERAGLERQVSELAAERNEAQASLDARFQELAQLTRQLEDQRQTLEQAEAEREQSRAERDRALNDNQALEAQREQASAERRTTDQALEEARHSLQERFEELATLTELLEEREREDEHEQPTAQAPGDDQSAATDDQPAEPPSALEAPAADTNDAAAAQTSRSDRDGAEQLHRDAELVQQSGMFNARWYLEHYPDIAQHPHFSGEPLLHYLLHGGYEGRNPSADFDSAFYLAAYPDVRESGDNPLVHYLRFGQQEQRQVREE